MEFEPQPQREEPVAEIEADDIGEAPAIFKTLPKEIRRHGFRYVQLDRHDGPAGKYAVYEQWTRRTNRLVAHEVIRIKNHPAGEIMGAAFAAGESYPRSEEWGSWGWTCLSKEKALEKLESLRGRGLAD